MISPFNRSCIVVYVVSLTTFCCSGLFSGSAMTAADEVKITISTSNDEPESDPKAIDAVLPGNELFSGDRPAVDVAILLDTSNSMDGLINQAKAQLWTIVQQFAEAKKRGKTPHLRVSVFEYGNTNLPAREGFIRTVTALTDDLDVVSESLFALSTNGGDEYCGMVINEALKRLDWTDEPNAYKAIFIAGNEPFTQGSVDYQTACESAIQSGVVVNTIHCGNQSKGIQGKWQHAAQLAEGESLNIDQDEKIVQINAPQDPIVIKLNEQLNKTYLWFGSQSIRRGYETNQLQQDKNSSSIGNIASRIQSKVGSVYSNTGRDLVDSYASDLDRISEVEESELPEKMQSMNLEERKAYVRLMAEQRAEIKKKIADASQQRAEFVKSERAKMPQGMSGGATFGDAFAETVNDQLKASGFEVGDQ